MVYLSGMKKKLILKTDPQTYRNLETLVSEIENILITEHKRLQNIGHDFYAASYWQSHKFHNARLKLDKFRAHLSDIQIREGERSIFYGSSKALPF